MALTILDVGDRIRLTQPWTFTVVQEQRNHEFAVAMDLMAVGTEWDTIMHRVGLVTGKNYYQTRPFPASEEYYFIRDAVGRLTGDRRCMVREDALPESEQATLTMIRNWQPQVTLLDGVELTVDRVYLRKGGKEFSSLSFRVTDWGPRYTPPPALNIRGFKKQHRFFARLADCRNIAGEVSYAP